MKKIISILILFVLTLSAFAGSALTLSASAATLPTAYNNDPSNVQYSTAVKSQGDYGNCWAFAAIACCEADAIKNHGASKLSTDLSELHLAYFAYNGDRIGTGDKVNTQAPFYEHGGYSQLPIFTFSNWIGLVDEDVAKYSDFTKNPTMKLDESIMYKNVEYYLKNAYTYSLPEDIERLKEAIYTYGAAETSYYSHDVYYNATTSAHYCYANTTSNHAVTIVGWDDNYSKNNFKGVNKPTSNGAWLVKNSWGSDWGINGYFWISYEDKSIEAATVFDVVPAGNEAYDNNYQHDGGVSLTYSNYDKTSAANIFTAKGNELLTAISVMTYEKKDSYYDLKIYVNPADLSPRGFENTAPVHTQSGTLKDAGYNTIELTSPVTLSKNDTFIVLVETNAYLAIDSDFSSSNGSGYYVTSSAGVEANQTYFSFNDSAFYDTSTNGGSSKPFNARIKAFTKNTELGEAKCIFVPTLSAIKYGQSLSSSIISGGEVVDSISGHTIRGVWGFSDPDYIPDAGSSIAVKVKFTPENPEYNTIEKLVNISIEADKPKITIKTDKSSYKGGDTMDISASVIQNKHSASVTELPPVKFYYRIDDGAVVYFSGKFTLPQTLSGKKITVGIKTDAVSGKYLESGTEIILQAPSSGSDNNDDNNTPPSKDTDNSGETSKHPIKDTDNSTVGGTPPSTQKPSETTSQGTQSSSKDSVKDMMDDAFKESISGCFSNAAVSALAVVSIISGLAFIKRKKD